LLWLNSIPHVSLIAVCAFLMPSHSLWTAMFVAFLVMALLAPVDGFQLGRAARPVTESAAAPALFIWRFADHAWPLLLTFVFLLENAFAIDGIGAECVRGFRSRDLHLLMGLATISALASLLVVEFASRKTENSRVRTRSLGGA
jgi:hypothetical protein